MKFANLNSLFLAKTFKNRQRGMIMAMGWMKAASTESARAVFLAFSFFLSRAKNRHHRIRQRIIRLLRYPGQNRVCMTTG